MRLTTTSRVAPDPEADEVIVNLNGESTVTSPYLR
jgi:hypothetical protein